MTDCPHSIRISSAWMQALYVVSYGAWMQALYVVSYGEIRRTARLEGRVAWAAWEGDDVADVGHPRAEHDRALEAEPEA